MKNLDLLSKRILIISVSITMVLCSASLLVYSFKTAVAAPLPVSAKPAVTADFNDLCQEWPMGISDGKAYFMEDNQGQWSFVYKSLTKFKSSD